MKKLEIKNNTGYYFPVCDDMINGKLDECGFVPTHIEVGLYSDDFVVSICGANNTGLRAYTVSKADYSRNIATILKMEHGYFGKIEEADRARGYGYWKCDWYYVNNKENNAIYNNSYAHIVGEQARAWCLVLAHLLTPKNNHFNVQYNLRFEVDWTTIVDHHKAPICGGET